MFDSRISQSSVQVEPSTFLDWRFFIFRHYQLNFEKTPIIDSIIRQYSVLVKP
jgi:hypothetical protein